MRKMHFAMRADALVVFPGGFGTFDELFEMLTLRQTGKMDDALPIVLYDSAFWKRSVNFAAPRRCGIVRQADLDLFGFADTPQEAWKKLIAARPRASRNRHIRHVNHLQFHGATRTVTGSCYLIETGSARVLSIAACSRAPRPSKELNYRAFPFDPHKHRCHAADPRPYRSFRPDPQARQGGLRQQASMRPTPPAISRGDAAGFRLHPGTEVKLLNSRNRKRGLPEVEPIYTAEDAHQALEHFEGIAYKTWITPVPGIRARYWNAGHLLGSASIEVEVEQAEIRCAFCSRATSALTTSCCEPDPEASNT